VGGVLVHVGCEFVQRAEMPRHTVLQVEPRTDGDFRMVDACWDEQTSAASRAYVDALGNVCRRLTLPAGRSVIRSDAHAEVSPEGDGVDGDAVEVPPEALPDTVLSYTLPSRFCPSDELGDVAWGLFGATPPGWTRVQTISDWVHEAVAFDDGGSASTATALDVLAARAGCAAISLISAWRCAVRSASRRATRSVISPISVSRPPMLQWTSAPGWRCS
jgi:transglutaminase-like putative cysteine protease